MADSKISALPASTTPLTGTEVLPIVQGGVTKQVSVTNLTSGKAVSATQFTSTIATGTAPLVVTSTTNVPNLNASSLNGATFASPGAIGSTTPAAGTFTTLNATRFQVLSNTKTISVGSPTSIYSIITNNTQGGLIRIVVNGTHTGVAQVISSYTFLIGYNGVGAVVGAVQTNAGSATLTFSTSYSGVTCTVSAQLTGGIASSMSFSLDALGGFGSITVL
jgi:hypothetical protein